MALKINCVGLVQGVGFRYFTKQAADELKLEGHVQNLGDGSVLIYVTGKKDVVMNFLKWCHKGPKSGHVISLEYDEIEIQEIPKLEKGTFHIIR